VSAQQISTEGRDAFFDAVRLVCSQVIHGYFAEMHEAIGIDRAVPLVQDRIFQLRKSGDWHFAKAPVELDIRRRINELADARRYPGGNPPLRCLGWRMYQGKRESQYRPFETEQ
jgi:hypothetical protein